MNQHKPEPSVTTLSPIAVRPWAPRDPIAPILSGDLATSFRVRSNGSAGCYGGWELVYPAGGPGDYFLFQIKVRWRDLNHGFESLSAEAMWLNEEGRRVDWVPINEWKKEHGWVTLQKLVSNKADASRLVVKLLLRWSATGEVEWKDPQLLPSEAPPSRRIRLGAAGEQPPRGNATLESNRTHYLTLCEKAGHIGVDLLCLPEVILSWRVPGQNSRNLADYAVEVPGPEIEPFRETARNHHMGICFSVLEKENELIHNTSVLVDEKGNIAAKYRKVHVAVPQEMWHGVTPGEGFPIVTMHTADASVGMNICMDSSAAEAARAVARLGAEILMIPIMGDDRADRWSRGRPQFDVERWMMIQKMRAMDNHLYLVAARNESVGTGIFAPDGTILAMDGGDQTVVWADVDLADLKETWTGASFQDMCWVQRRESQYGVLSGSLLPTLDD